MTPLLGLRSNDHEQMQGEDGLKCTLLNCIEIGIMGITLGGLNLGDPNLPATKILFLSSCTGVRLCRLWDYPANYPPPPLPPRPSGASSQQLVVKGAGLRSPWAPKVPEGNCCPLCSPTLSLNPSQILTPTPAPSLVLALIKTEYWDRAGGGGNISYDW